MWQFHLVEDSERVATCAERKDEDYWAEGELSNSLSNSELSEMIDKCVQLYWESRGKKVYFNQNLN